ncbi:MAG: exodeoxyribonuclease III [Thermoanaerobaculia bacterium]
MLVATWNINGLRARFDFLVHWLRARKPDLVGLQELKLEEDQFPREELEAEGYHAAVHGQKAWNGVAVLSRKPAEIVHRGLSSQEEAGARLLAVQVDGLTFTTLYCPNGKSVDHEDFPRKLEWLDSLARHLESSHSSGEPLILCGDFNICPGPLDTWNEKGKKGSIFHTDEERSRFQALLDWGLVDVYRRENPEGRDFSWWDYRGGAFHRGMGLRIDFLLATEPVAGKVREVVIDRDYRKKKDGLTASDHAPVMADLG